jgi:LuxR family maltose regulon positive regulatory protein
MIWWLEIPAVTHCRVLLAKETEASLQEAEEKLREHLDQNKANHNTCHMIHIMPLLALAYKKQDRTEEALTILEEAVVMGEPGGWIRPFIELGPPMADMLQQLHKQNVAVEYIERLLSAFRRDEQVVVPDESDQDISSPVPPSPISQPLLEPLTNRELEILELLAQRLQNKEIAEKLFVSTETVKSHLKNIFGKLNASNRREAVQRAKTLNIL